MSFFGSYQQPQYQQQYPQAHQSGFGGFFGSGNIFGGNERLTFNTIEQIVLQLQQQGIPPQIYLLVKEELTQMLNKKTEQISNILKQFISPELTQ